MTDSNINFKTRVGKSSIELNQIINDTTGSIETSSISEQDEYSDFQSQDNDSIIEDENVYQGVNKDIMIVNHNSPPQKQKFISNQIPTKIHLKLPASRKPQNRYLKSNALTSRNADMILSLNSRSKEFKKFQDKLQSLDFQPQNYFGSDSQGSICKSPEYLNSPNTVRVLPNVFDKQERIHDNSQEKFNRSDLEVLSEILKMNYGVSDDILNDMKFYGKGQKQSKYIIMLKRIIKGKAKVEDINQDDKKEDALTNSIMTNDSYINSKLNEFRTRVLNKSQKKRYPHVFSRLQNDVRKRQTATSRVSNIQ